MPQTRFLGRRWRLATDALPLVFYPIVSGLSIAMFILLLSLMGVILDSRYSCDQYTKVAVALFSMTVIYFLDVIIYTLIVYTGWRGAPLNESKRMPQAAVLVHTWVALSVIKAGFTGYGMYVVYSPKISASCWSDNPCEYYGQTTLQRACVPGATGETTLTPACQVVFPRADEYLACALTWSEYGAGWMVENYRGRNETTGDADFDFPGVVSCTVQDENIDTVGKYLNQNDLERYDKIISKWPDLYRPDNLYGFLYSFFVIEDEFARNPSKVSAWLQNGMTDDEEREILLSDNFIEEYMTAAIRYASGNASAIVQDTPWNTCMSPSCMEMLSENCTQWRIMAELPNVYRWRGLFEAIMYVSVAVIVLTIIIFAVSFNAFPDYQSKESWEGLLSGLARRIEGYADYDQSWLAGVGALLWGLFGGVDLDVTDLLLGLYLVWLRQKWKRKERVLSELESQGYDVLVQGENVWWSAFGGFLLYPLGMDWRLFSGRRWKTWRQRRRRWGKGVGKRGGDTHKGEDRDMKGGEGDEENGPVPPGSEEGSTDQCDALEDTLGNTTQTKQLLTLQHSMARIPSFSPDQCESEVHIEESHQSRAFLTPLVMRRLKFAGTPPDRPLEEIYLGKSQDKDKVDRATLEMLRYYLPFARASYGLNRGVWKACTKYRWYDWGYRLGKPAYFERKNYEMLLEMMGAAERDVLHASYDLGTHLKPYLIVADGDDIVVSIRGTVGAADLITDLLSQPIDDGAGVLYHVGMLSSARAVVSDMKNKGVWNDLMARCTQGTSKVVLTGHSLGAGLAYLVATELVKDGADTSRVSCFAFNPPGGLSSETSSKLDTHYSVIVNKDAISRMSITTMKRLVDDMMISLGRCNRPKLSIFFDGVLLGRYAECDWNGVFKPFEAMHSEERSVLFSYLEKGKLSAGTGGVNNEYVLPMYPPGKLVFLRKLREEAWDAVWINAEELMDEGLLVDTAMARDHMLRTTVAALDRALERATGRGGQS